MKPLRKKPFNEGKSTTSQIYYQDQNEEPIPVSTMLGLPVTGIGTSMKRGIYVYPTGDYNEIRRKSTRGASITVVENPYSMFDGKLSTLSVWHFENGKTGSTESVYLHFGGDSYKISSVSMLIEFVDGSISDLSFETKDINGTSYSLKTSSSTIDIQGDTYTLVKITGFPNNEIIELKVTRASGAFEFTTMDVYELRFNKKSVFGGSVDVNIPSQRDIISWDDIQSIIVDSGTTATDFSKMFDLNTKTYCELTANELSKFTMYLKEPTKMSKVLLLLGVNDSQNIRFYYKGDDDSGYLEGAITPFSGEGASYLREVTNPYPNKEVIAIEWKGESHEDIYEFYAYKLKEGYIVDSSGTIINPPTKEIQEEQRDQLSLPNEDINIQTSPSANTDYSVEIDVGRGNKVVTSLYSDQVPSAVKIEGSNDNTNFYKMDGISIDTSSWNTSEYNIYEFEPYTRYIKITLTTPDTAPTRVELYIKGVRP